MCRHSGSLWDLSLEVSEVNEWNDSTDLAEKWQIPGFLAVWKSF